MDKFQNCIPHPISQFTNEQILEHIETKRECLSFVNCGKYIIVCYQNVEYNEWTDILECCRGLVLDSKTREIVAYGFPKFRGIDTERKYRHHFHKYQHDCIGIVTEKYDGSMVVAFIRDGELFTTTKASMKSTQAVWSKTFLLEKGVSKAMKEGYVYIFECVFKANRLVTAYDFDDLILLSVYDRKCLELPFYSVQIIAEQLGVRKLEGRVMTLEKMFAFAKKLAKSELCPPNVIEGMVIRLTDGTRFKIVFPEYKEAKKMYHRVSPLKFWRMMYIDRHLPMKIAFDLWKRLSCDKEFGKEVLDIYTALCLEVFSTAMDLWIVLCMGKEKFVKDTKYILEKLCGISGLGDCEDEDEDEDEEEDEVEVEVEERENLLEMFWNGLKKNVKDFGGNNDDDILMNLLYHGIIREDFSQRDIDEITRLVKDPDAFLACLHHKGRGEYVKRMNFFFDDVFIIEEDDEDEEHEEITEADLVGYCSSDESSSSDEESRFRSERCRKLVSLEEKVLKVLIKQQKSYVGYMNHQKNVSSRSLSLVECVYFLYRLCSRSSDKRFWQVHRSIAHLNPKLVKQSTKKLLVFKKRTLFKILSIAEVRILDYIKPRRNFLPGYRPSQRMKNTSFLEIPERKEPSSVSNTT